MNVLQPFSSTVWIGILLTLVAMVLVTAVLQKIQNMVTDNVSNHSSVLLIIGVVFQESRYVLDKLNLPNKTLNHTGY